MTAQFESELDTEDQDVRARPDRDSSDRRSRLQRPDVRLTLDVSNVDDALAEAAAQWHLPVDDVEATVLSSAASFLGLFGKKLHVEVKPKAPLLLLQGQHFIEELLKLMEFDASVALKLATAETVEGVDGELEDYERDDPEDAMDVIELDGPDAEEFIVGRYGDVLKSLEYLLNLALRDPSVEPRVRLDCCGYRERRTRSLERLAEATARQAVEYGRPIRLEPMLSWERWVIHMTLKGRDDVRTESVGETPMRKVVIMPTYQSESGIDGGYSSRRSRYLRPRSFTSRSYDSRRHFDDSRDSRPHYNSGSRSGSDRDSDDIGRRSNRRGGRRKY